MSLASSAPMRNGRGQGPVGCAGRRGFSGGGDARRPTRVGRKRRAGGWVARTVPAGFYKIENPVVTEIRGGPRPGSDVHKNEDTQYGWQFGCDVNKGVF